LPPLLRLADLYDGRTASSRDNGFSFLNGNDAIVIFPLDGALNAVLNNTFLKGIPSSYHTVFEIMKSFLLNGNDVSDFSVKSINESIKNEFQNDAISPSKKTEGQLSRN